MQVLETAQNERLTGVWEQTMPSWEGLLERLPVGVHLYDGDGVLMRANARARDICAAPFADGEVDRALSGGRTAGRSPVSEALRTEAPVSDREIVVDAAGGRRLHLLTNTELVRDDLGMVVGAIVCFQSVDAIDRARDDLRLERAWARRMFENSPVAVYWTDASGFVRAFNPAAEMLWGRRPDFGRDRWCGFMRLFHADGRPMAHEEGPLAAAILSGRSIVGGEIGYERPDGGRGSVLAYPTPLYDDTGALVGGINMLVDITDRKQAETRQKVLLDELNHRVKNTLATIQSLAGQSFRGDGEPAAMVAAFEARLLALSKAHDQLAERHWSDADLKSLATAVLAPFNDERVTLDGGPLRLSSRAAVTIAMALNELAANAERFGALSTPNGRLHVSWRPDVAGGLELSWMETNGPPVSPPSRRGFGRRFLEAALSRELGGHADLEFAPEGFRCMIRTPAERENSLPVG